jgi:glycosyltransferase involved in cell wall biosynthesis
MVLLHAGLLYGGGGRNANTLIQGIAKAFERQSSVRGKLLLRLIGAGPGGDEALTQSRALGLGAAVELLPQMPQSECDREMARADVLVAIKFDDPQYDMQVPGKIFQYLAYGKPILGLMRETEAAAVLRRSGLGIVKANSDIDGIASALLELWNDHVSGLARFQPNWEFIKTFSLSATAKTLNTELLRLLQCEDEGPRSVRNDPGSNEPKSNFCPEMPKPS